MAIEEIERVLSTRGGATAAGAAAPEARFLSYLVQVVHAHHPPAKLGEMGREMRTLAEIMDAILLGDLPRAADLCVQRFKGCEARAQGTSSALAAQYELIPNRAFGLAGSAEQMYVGQLELQRAKLSEIEDRSKKNEKSG